MKDQKETRFPEEFRMECCVLKLEKEYPEYTGTEKYLILTDLTHAQLQERYRDIIARFEPCIVAGRQMLEVINDYRRNESKHAKRMERRQQVSLSDADLTEEDFITEKCREAETCLEQAAVMLALGMLSKKMSSRLWARYALGKTLEEIAAVEGVSVQAVDESIRKAKELFSRYYGAAESRLKSGKDLDSLQWSWARASAPKEG